MLNYVYKLVMVIAVMSGLGLATPAWADAGQFKLDMILAKRGDADAMYYVANAYEEGRGVETDLSSAYAWYNKAASQNHAAAQYKLGLFLENGRGVEQDIKQAMDWYKQAADNGNTQARERLDKAAFARSEAVMKRRIVEMKEERAQREQQQKLEKERARAQAQAENRAKQAESARKTAMASRPATKKTPTMPDIVDVVLNNKWSRGGDSADYLPSASTNCLRASDTEIVCFSSEKQRVVNGQRVTYTAKGVLSGFRSDGRFQVKYNYNAVKLDAAQDRGVAVDPHGLKLEQGWQEPQMVLNCQAADRSNLYCTRNGVRLHYHN